MMTSFVRCLHSELTDPFGGLFYYMFISDVPPATVVIFPFFNISPYVATKSSIRSGLTTCIACFLEFNSVSYCAFDTDTTGFAVTVVDPL